MWHTPLLALGPVASWPTLRSVPDSRRDLGFGRRLPAILAGRREDEFRVMRDLLREEISLRLGLFRYSTLGSCNLARFIDVPSSRPPLPNSTTWRTLA